MMQVLRCHSKIESDGHLRLDLPTKLPAGEIELIVVISSTAEERSSPRKYDFSDLVGKLNWQGDAVAMQRRLRDEW